MNAPTKTLTLMALLAAGAAAAQTAAPERTGNLTNAGTSITNTATATYDVPNTDGTTTGGTTSSNTVTTTVAAKMAFDITYTTGADSDTTDTVVGAISSYQKTGVLPGSTVVFSYVAVNNGNASQTINLSSEASTGASNVVYYSANPDANNDGIISATEKSNAAGTIITSLTIAPSGDNPATTSTVETNPGFQNFWMTYDVTGAPDVVVGATPIGSGQSWDGTTNVAATEQKDPGAPTYDDLWYQYSSAKIFAPNLTTTPDTTPIGGGSVDTPPSGGTLVPGYTDPGGTVVAVSGDEQIAYPKVDNIDGTDTVVFTNTVTNGSTVPDTVTLTIEARTNVPNYLQTVTPVAGQPGVYTVTQTNPDGSTTTATVTITTPNGTTVAPGGSLDYTVTVTYTDQDKANPYPIYVAVGVDSGNDTDSTPNDLTYDTVLPGAFQFGDPATGIAADATPAVPKTGAASSTVTFPMEVANTGEYTDSYKLSGYTIVTLTDGTKQIVPIVYTGTGVTATATTITADLNGDGDTSDAGESVPGFIYTTADLTANTEVALNASITLPANVASTNGDNYELIQSATSVYSNVTRVDNNDYITVVAAGSLAVGKFTQSTTTVVAGSEFITCTPTCTVSTTAPATGYVSNPANFTALNTTTYAPGVNYSYKILAKNTYNTSISKFTVKDTTPVNTTFQGASLTISGFTAATAKVLYSTDGGTSWSAVAPATGTANVTVAVDLNGDGALTSADVLPSGGQVELTLTVSVN